MAGLDRSGAWKESFLETIFDLGLEGQGEIRRPPGRSRAFQVLQRHGSGGEITKQTQRQRTNLVYLDQRQI